MKLWCLDACNSTPEKLSSIASCGVRMKWRKAVESWRFAVRNAASSRELKLLTFVLRSSCICVEIERSILASNRVDFSGLADT
jgi:hypothetical protein